jgi:hypothetical protein
MIHTLGVGVGMAPIKTIDMDVDSPSMESPGGNVLRLTPKS